MLDQGSSSTASLRVFTFSPDWGLPTNGPFALKLLAWLELAGTPYEQVVENNSGKGPKGKSPWIELGGERIGDSELIIERLGRQHGIDLDEGLSPEQRAIGLAWRRTFEEHFHQVLEWELLLHPAGATYMREFFGRVAPRPVAPLLFSMIRRQFRRQLHARGIARHTPEVIAAKGRADLDALAAYLEDRSFLVAITPLPQTRPSSACSRLWSTGRCTPLWRSTRAVFQPCRPTATACGRGALGAEGRRGPLEHLVRVVGHPGPGDAPCTYSFDAGHPASFAMPDVLVRLAAEADTVLTY